MSTTPDNPGDSLLMKWIKDHLDYPHKDYCLLWPFKSKRVGYGFFIRDKKTYSVHRVICEKIHGPAPDGHVAAHSCGRGHDGCANPHHLSWKTHSGNQLDRLDGKGKRKRSKLTYEKASEIREAAESETVMSLAKRFGVSPSAIQNVLWGVTWNGQSKRPPDLTVSQVLYLREMNGIKPRSALAKEMGISHNVVWKVQTGRAYAHVKQP